MSTIADEIAQGVVGGAEAVYRRPSTVAHRRMGLDVASEEAAASSVSISVLGGDRGWFRRGMREGGDEGIDGGAGMEGGGAQSLIEVIIDADVDGRLSRVGAGGRARAAPTGGRGEEGGGHLRTVGGASVAAGQGVGLTNARRPDGRFVPRRQCHARL